MYPFDGGEISFGYIYGGLPRSYYTRTNVLRTEVIQTRLKIYEIFILAS